jgi:hypothetical protein
MSKGVYPSEQVKRPLIDVPMYQKWNLFGLLGPALLGPAVIHGTFGVVVVGGALGGWVLGPASSCWKGCVSRCANSGLSFRIAVATSLAVSHSASLSTMLDGDSLSLFRQTKLVRIPSHIDQPLPHQSLHPSPSGKISPLFRMFITTITIFLCNPYNL